MASAGHLVSTDLSGGADSGVVTVLAARAQAARRGAVCAITFGSSRPEMNRDVPSGG